MPASENRKQRNSEQLLDEGVRIMMMRGYHATGIQELVDTVGVPKGSFYQYFDSKEKFGAAAIRHYIDPYIKRLRGKLDESPDDALEALHAYFDDLTEEAEQNNFEGGCLLGNLLGEIGDRDGDCLEALKKAVEDYCFEFERIVEQAQAQNRINSSFPASHVAQLIFSTWQGALLLMKVERSTRALHVSITTLLDHSLRPC